MFPGKCAKNLTFFLPTTFKMTNSKKQEKNLLTQDVKMDACANFTMNGDIIVCPCPWEKDKQVTDGGRVRYRAGVEVDADGHTRVKRYRDGENGPKHDVLYETVHGVVKMTRPQYPPSSKGRRRKQTEFVYMVFKYPKKLGLTLIKSLYQEEADEILSYLKTRKEDTIWE